MTFHRALALVAVLALAVLTLAGLSEAVAQFPPPPGQAGTVSNQSSPFPPPPGQGSPFPPPQGSNPCDAFVPIRQDAEKSAAAIKAAGERKASREEVCPLFQKFAVAESKMVKFLETHRVVCRVPPDAIKQSKATHARTLQVRNNVCNPAAAAAGPRLSDALGGPLVPDATPKPGRGTFDTLTGSPLGR
jgi:hypothetical protein